MNRSEEAQIQEDVLRLSEGGADTEMLLRLMRERGLGQVDSSLMLARVCGLEHGRALKTVLESRAWADRLEDNIKTQDLAMQILLEMSHENDPNFKIEVEWEPESPEDDEAPGQKR